MDGKKTYIFENFTWKLKSWPLPYDGLRLYLIENCKQKSNGKRESVGRSVWTVNLQKKTFLRFYSDLSQRTFPSFVKGYISPKISTKILNSHHKLKWQTDNKPSWPSIMVIQRHPTASNKKRREPTETVRSHSLTPLSAYIDKFRVQSLAHNSHLNFISLSFFLSLAKIFSKSQVSAFSLTLEI